MLEFLRVYLRTGGSLTYQANTFEALIEEFATYLFEFSDLQVEAKAVIVNSNLGNRVVELTDGLVLRSPTDAERNFIQDVAA